MIPILLLAAGESKRLGTPKQLLPYKGKTIIRTIAENAVPLGKVFVITGAHHDSLVAELQDLGLTFIQNPDWQEGMGSSIRTGIINIIENIPEATGVMILLADQPLVTNDHLKILLEAFKTNEVVLSSYQGINGVPAIIGKSHFKFLSLLTGDKGARSILGQLTGVAHVAMDDNPDIDTMDDYRKLIK